MENILDKVREKIKTHILCSITFFFFFRKSHCLWDNVEKYSGDRVATNDATIWRTHVACWTSKTTCTYAHAHAHAPGYPYARTHARTDQYVIFLASPGNNDSRTRLNVTLFYLLTKQINAYMPPSGFEPASPASRRPQTLALDRPPTKIGSWLLRVY
jgi:hypothetical protein